MAFDQSNNFLGRGWSFPPTFNKQLKEVLLTEKIEDIEKSLQLLLSTSIGERIMQPRYGCNMDDLIFESMDTATKTLIIDRIKSAILFFESRIVVKKIALNTQNELEGEILVEVEYEIPATNSRYNFVFPFYKKEGTELGFLTGL